LSLTIVLLEPQIPPNTGNIARLCAATGCQLHLVGKLGFSLSDKHLKRAGLDYWDHVHWTYFEDLAKYMDSLDSEKSHFLTTKTSYPYYDARYGDEDYLVFGSETKGIDEDILKKYSHRVRTIPMKNQSKGVRSLNLSTSVGIVLFEALRQHAKMVSVP